MERSIPSKIAERYQIKGTIGSGGMGVVLLGYDPNLGIDVAIKMLQKDADEKAIARLQREAMLAGRLNHVHIGKVFDFGTAEDESPYMVMEYFKGQTLADLISYKNGLSYEEARVIFIQLCEALLHAHHQGIVHRDLKPSNVFLAKQGQGIHGGISVKLLDFGVAKVESTSGEITSAGSIVGSPAYMSPELAEGVDADHRSDIYSLGCLMFETLVATPPFQGKTVLETIQMHRNNAPPLVSEELGAQSDVPKAIDEIIDKCLQKSPANRPQQVSEILQILQPVEQIAAREVQEEANYIKVRDSIFDKLGINPIVSALVVAVIIALVSLASSFVIKDAQKKASQKTDELRENAITKDSSVTAEIIKKGAGYLYDKIEVNPMINLKFCKLRELAGDEEFKYIAPLDFEALDIWDSEITGVGLNYVKDKKNLKWLKMKLSKDKQDLVSYACNIKSLEYLEIRSPEFTSSDFLNISRLKKLKRLCLGPKRLEWDGLNKLKNMPLLQAIGIQAEHFPDGSDNAYGHGKVNFEQFPNLQELSVVLEGVTDSDLSGLVAEKKLISAALISNQLTDKTIEYLYPSAGTLNVLSLVSKKISSNIGEKLSVFPMLQRIELGNGKPISEKSARVIASRILFELKLDNSPCTDQILSILSKNKTVYRLVLGKTQLTDAGYEQFSKFVNLINLSLENEVLTDEKVRNLSKSQTIKELYLGNSNLTNKQIVMLANMRNLELLKVDKCPNVSEGGARLMEEKFRQLWNKKPPKLNMDSNQLIEDFAK